MHQWFLQDEVWHAFYLDSIRALCGEAQIVYGIDPISDFVPEGATAHAGCEEALATSEPPTFQPADAPEPEPEPEAPLTVEKAHKPKRRSAKHK